MATSRYVVYKQETRYFHNNEVTLIAVLQGRRKMSDDRLFATSYRYEVRNPNAKMLQKALTLQKSRIEVKLLGDKLTVTYSV